MEREVKTTDLIIKRKGKTVYARLKEDKDFNVPEIAEVVALVARCATLAQAKKELQELMKAGGFRVLVPASSALAPAQTALVVFGDMTGPAQGTRAAGEKPAAERPPAEGRARRKPAPEAPAKAEATATLPVPPASPAAAPAPKPAPAAAPKSAPASAAKPAPAGPPRLSPPPAPKPAPPSVAKPAPAPMSKTMADAPTDKKDALAPRPTSPAPANGTTALEAPEKKRRRNSAYLEERAFQDFYKEWRTRNKIPRLPHYELEELRHGEWQEVKAKFMAEWRKANGID